MWMKERLSSRGAVHLHVVVLLSHVSGIIYTYIHKKIISYTLPLRVATMQFLLTTSPLNQTLRSGK